MDYAALSAWLRSLSPLGVQLGTERVMHVLERLGRPQDRFAALHVAGTNGKGSTSAMAAALLGAAGQAAAAAAGRAPRIGLYTSPHLLRLTERMQIDAGDGIVAECPPAEFAAAVTAVRDAASASPAQELTFFEVLTAAAFHWFAVRGVEVAVVETGLGGRLDATRLCRAVATAVTSIGLDHAELLGPTLPEIAREKAGIFRPGVPALVACDDPAALAVLAEGARQAGAPLYQYDTGIGLVPDRAGVVPPLPEAWVLPLPGAHQRRNAALALALCRHLPALAPSLRNPAVQQAGLLRARWPGRLERVVADEEGAEIWLDAAHNPEGTDALARWLEEHLSHRPLGVLLGVVAGKEVAGMLAPLRRARAVVLTRPPTPRALPPEDLFPQVRAATPAGADVRVCADPLTALRQARALTPPGGRLLVYGSIFLVGAIRGLLLGEPADPIPLQDPMRGGP